MVYLRRLLRSFVRPAGRSKLPQALVRDQEEVQRSGLFDADWYLQQYPDVSAAGIDPLRHYMDHGWRESRNPNLLFDSKWYLDNYPDVSAAEFNPLLHYMRHGAVERRDTGPKFRPSIFQDPRTPRGAHHLAAALTYLRKITPSDDGRDLPVFATARILIIAELTIPQCRRYRVDQKCELLRLQGYASTVVNWHDAAQCEAALTTHSMVIFYRVPAIESVLRYIAKAKALRLPTFWEVDDLIFDPNAYMANSSLKTVTPEIQRAVLSGVPNYRAAMLACDEAIASTRTLAKAMRDAGVARVHIVENALDVETLAAAKRAVATARKTDDAVRIVYGSGTNTHDEDFMEAAGAIRACLKAYPQVKLRIIGELNLPKDFARFGKRIERFSGTSYRKYLQLMAACDIAIAPLEPTLFNDAKSNIKFIEATMVGLPSVCSSRAEFVGIIEHGQNGMLASDSQTWFAGLEALILSQDLRRGMAALAKDAVLARYSPENVAKTQLAPIIQRLDAPRKPLRVLAANVFFEPRSFGGATIVAEQMAYRLNARADTEMVVFTTAPAGTAEPYQLLKYNIGSIPVFAVCLPETYDPALSFDTDHTLHSFREVLRLTNPDVVHFHSIQGLGAQLLKACEEEGVPVVVTLHDAWWICGRQFMIKGNGSYCFQTRIDLNVCSACVPDAGLNLYRQYRLRDMLDRADLLLTPSSFFHGIYAANDFPPERLKVNRNGVARPVNFRRSPSNRLRFGYVGGNAAVKGAHLIQKVFAQLERSDYELVVIDNLLSLGFSSVAAGDWPIKGQLKILPAYNQDNMDSFYSQIDVLLFPTQWKESFGLTVREALIRDIWVITTDAGGVVEDVVDGENGDVIPLLDDGTALKVAVERALDRVEAMMSHCNPYKADIADHEQQAEELHGFLSAASRRSRPQREVFRPYRH
jgi:glycosyltransferase involved in cell wall biosynthesis